ncbi:MAG: tetratricopeptide repeat protein [Amphiplicatus sp.]
MTGLIAVLAAAPASAQMAVTTIGATDAVLCYQNAASDFSQDTGPCDDALRDVQSRSDRKKTLVNRGIIYNRAGDYRAAFADFDAALEIDRSLAEAYVNRGNTYFLTGRNDEAIGDYERSITLGVNKPWAAWYNIGLVYEAKGNAGKARDAYVRSLELNPNFTQAEEKLKLLDRDKPKEYGDARAHSEKWEPVFGINARQIKI